MFTKTDIIQIRSILDKQDVVFKLQADQVAEILHAIQEQVELNRELRELLGELAATGEQPESSAMQAMEQMDSSITLASEELAAVLTQVEEGAGSVITAFPEPEVTSAIDSANHTSSVAPPTVAATSEPEIT
ncbi:hypothetical protein HDU81_001461, partial [Chytriomyces hyalinus]